MPDPGRARAVAFVRVGDGGLPFETVGDVPGIAVPSGFGGIDAVGVAVLGRHPLHPGTPRYPGKAFSGGAGVYRVTR